MTGERRGGIEEHMTHQERREVLFDSGVPKSFAYQIKNKQARCF